MIRRSTLRAQITTALRDEILAGRLAPGAQFTVKEIAEQYGVSATPVREALVDLAGQGLLDVEQHRGYRVHEFGRDDYLAMCEARTLVVEGVLQRFPWTVPTAPTRPRTGPTASSTPTVPDSARAPGAGAAGTGRIPGPTPDDAPFQLRDSIPDSDRVPPSCTHTAADSQPHTPEPTHPRSPGNTGAEDSIEPRAPAAEECPSTNPAARHTAETDPPTSAAPGALDGPSESSSNARPAANPDISSGVRGALRCPGAGATPDESSRPASTVGPAGAEQGGLITRHVGRQTLTSIRRRAEAAGRAARAGDLDVLIAYDLRFWRELGGVLTNSYVCEFLDRLRVQCWAYVVPRLRRQEPLAGKLWADHGALVEAVEGADADESRHIIGDYNTHALTLAPDPGD